MHPPRPRRFLAPHPLVTLGGIAVAFAMYLVGRSTAFQPQYAYILFAVVFAVVFSTISRKSARQQAAKRDREMEELRRKPVFGLDDESP